jgi:hypothetical protein
MDPSIEAEEAADHSVKRCCELFEVSRAAYYQRRKQVPSARDVDDAARSPRRSARCIRSPLGRTDRHA